MNIKGRWSIDPLNLVHYAESDLLSKCRATAQSIFRDLVEISPVDSGRFRSNWVMDTKPLRLRHIPKGPTDLPPAEVPQLRGMKLGDTIYIGNGQDYAQRLNDGYSKQAPANFVERVMARYE